MGLISWTKHPVVTALIVTRTSFFYDLQVNPQGQQLQNWIFLCFIQRFRIDHPTGKKWRLSRVSLFCDTLPCKYLSYWLFSYLSGGFICLVMKGDSWKHRHGENWQYWILQFWYHGWIIRHHINRIEIQSSYYLKMLLNS